MVRIAPLIGAVALTIPAVAQANSASATMEVSLVVEPSCRVSATPLAFAGRAGQPLDATADIAVTCNDETPVSVRLDGGLNGTGGTRRLVGEGGHVEYAVYSDAARSLEWGAGEAVAGTASIVPLTLAAYGRIEADATLSATGAFRDSITVTVDF